MNLSGVFRINCTVAWEHGIINKAEDSTFDNPIPKAYGQNRFKIHSKGAGIRLILEAMLAVPKVSVRKKLTKLTSLGFFRRELIMKQKVIWKARDRQLSVHNNFITSSIFNEHITNHAFHRLGSYMSFCSMLV